MTDRDDRDGRESPGTPEPGAPRDPEERGEGLPGLVEDLKEEFHEVVEHVPAPVRWTLRRIAGLVALIVLGVFALLVASAILYVANRTEWVAREATLLINQTLASRSDVELRIGDLRGNPLTGLRVVGPSVRFREGDAPPLLEAEALVLRYSAWNLVTGGAGPIEVELVRPTIQFARGADGRLRLPAWKSEGGPRGAARRLEFRIAIRDGRVRSPGLGPGIEGLEARSTVRLGAGTRVDLERLGWRSGPYDNPLERLRASAEFSDSVRIRVLELKSRELTLRGRAAWKAGSAPRRVQLSLERVRWAWLAKVFDNGAFDVPGEARAEIEAEEAGAWTGSFRTSLEWNGLAAEGGGGFRYDRGTLELAGLDGRTASGRVLGRFEMKGKAWTLEARAEHADPRAWEAFHLPGWPEGDLNGEFRISQSATKDMLLTARLGPSVLAEWRADSARVWFGAPGTATDSFTVDFLRRGGRVRLEAGTRPWGWLGTWQARDFPLEEWPDGGRSGLRGTLAEGRGEVVSRDGALDVTGSLAGRSTEWLGARFDRWRLGGVKGRLLPAPDLVAVASLDDMMFLGLHFDSTRARLRLGDAVADLDSVAAHAGDTTLVLRGRAGWSERGWDLALERAEAVSRRFHWTAETPLTLSGDERGVVFDRLVAHDRDARLEVGGRWAAPGGSYEFEARGEAIDLARLGLPAEWRLAGRASGTLRVRGASGDPVWNFTARATRPGWGGHVADSASLALEGGRHRLDVRRASLAVDGGEATLAVTVEGTPRAWPDTLSGEGVSRWIAGASGWRGAAGFRDVELAGLDRLMPKPIGWSGRLDGDVAIGGRPGDPALKAKFAVSPFAWREFEMDQVAAEAALGERRLRVSRLEMRRGGVASTVTGEMPLHLALGEPAALPEAPMSWKAVIPRGDLAVMPAFVPQVGWSRGRFDMSASVGGTPLHPRLAGTLSVREGAVRLAGREEVLEGLIADFRFDENRVTLDSLRARQGRDGRVTGRGTLDLRGLSVSGYRFELALRNFTATEEGLYAAQFDGDFTVTQGPRVRGSVLPQVTGNVDVRRAAVLFDFANQSETQMLAASTKPLYWTYRVKLDATRNLRWQPPDGDLEFSADLTLEQTADSLLIYGDLRGERGTYYFLSNRFNVVRADLTFDNESGVNPQLDIEAIARVIPSQEPIGELGGAGESSRPHEVTARITGRADEPVVSFSSDPADWDESRILRELTVGRFLDRGGVQLGDPLDHYLTRAINRTMSAEVSRAFRGYVNEWALEREQGGLLRGEGDLVLGVGTQLTANLSLRYRQVLPGLSRGGGRALDAGGLFQRQVEAEYRLSRFFYLTTELAQRRLGSTPTTAATGPDFNVNLKARWEY